MELSSFTASVTLADVSWALLGGFGSAYISEFGFFFFLRMAVAVSSFCGGSAIAISERRLVMFTSRTSAPDGSLYIISHCFGVRVWWRANLL
jgi:hypothetical protein